MCSTFILQEENSGCLGYSTLLWVSCNFHPLHFFYTCALQNYKIYQIQESTSLEALASWEKYMC